MKGWTERPWWWLLGIVLLLLSLVFGVVAWIRQCYQPTLPPVLSKREPKFGFQVYNGLGFLEQAERATKYLEQVVPLGWEGRFIDPDAAMLLFPGRLNELFTEKADKTELGIENGRIALILAHGTTATWGTEAGEVALSEVRAGNDGLRYGFIYGCNVLAHGALHVSSSGQLSDYFHPEMYHPGDESVFDRWALPASQEMRLVCGGSTRLWDANGRPTESVWHLMKSGPAETPISVAFVRGLSAGASEIPLCLTRGGREPWDSPLSDRQFSREANAAAAKGYMQALYPVWKAMPRESKFLPSRWRSLTRRPFRLPVFRLGQESSTIPQAVEDLLKGLPHLGEAPINRRGSGWAIGKFETAFRRLGEAPVEPVKIAVEKVQSLFPQPAKMGLGPNRTGVSRRRSGLDLPNQEGPAAEPATEMFRHDGDMELRVDVVPDRPVGAFFSPSHWQAGGVGILRRELDVFVHSSPRSQEFQEVPVIGLGGKLFVGAGPNGEVTSLELTWRPIDMDGEQQSCQTCRVEAALALAKSDLGDSQSYVEDESLFEFGYKEEGFWVHQEVMEPVYRFVFVARDGIDAARFPPRPMEVRACDERCQDLPLPPE